MFYQNPYYFNNYYKSYYGRRPFHGGFYPGRQQCSCRGGFCRCDFGGKGFNRGYWGGWGF